MPLRIILLAEDPKEELQRKLTTNKFFQILLGGSKIH